MDLLKKGNDTCFVTVFFFPFLLNMKFYFNFINMQASSYIKIVVVNYIKSMVDEFKQTFQHQIIYFRYCGRRGSSDSNFSPAEVQHRSYLWICCEKNTCSFAGFHFWTASYWYVHFCCFSLNFIPWHSLVKYIYCCIRLFYKTSFLSFQCTLYIL